MEQGSRLLATEEIRELLKNANPTMHAFVLLAINGGLGNTDVARIEFDHLDLKRKILELPRSKTGKTRRCFLWPETIKSIKKIILSRSEPRDRELNDRLFLTRLGCSWVPTSKDNPVTKEFAKLKKKAKLTRKGISFYSLRHTFQTIGDETKDFVAVSSIMGHAQNSISDQYREQISDERLKSVSNYVRKWLFPRSKKMKG